MIDYWLGGTDHFPVDVAAATAFEQAYGPCAEIFRSLRAFSGRAVRYVAAQGVDRFLVFGAGVPTRGNVHESAPSARVLYTDLDPAVVAAGRDLVAGLDNVDYVRGDATDLAGIDHAAAGRVLDESPATTGRVLAESPAAVAPVLDESPAGPVLDGSPIGFVFLGLAAFLDDDTLARALDAMYDAAPPGSWLVFDFDATELAAYPAALEMMGPSFHMREPDRFADLLGRWRPTGDGVVPVARWRPDGTPEQVPDAFWGGVATKAA